MDIDKIIQDMGGAEKLEKFFPLPLEQLEPYVKAETLDKMIPGEFWIQKLGFYGNGVKTFYRVRTTPAFPKELKIGEMILVVKRALSILIDKKNAKRLLQSKPK
jgi:hypothetical protein